MADTGHATPTWELVYDRLDRIDQLKVENAALAADNVKLTERCARLEAVVVDLADSNPCEHFDHHGYCQTHGWLDDTECPHARAKRLLAGEKEPEVCFACDGAGVIGVSLRPLTTQPCPRCSIDRAVPQEEAK